MDNLYIMNKQKLTASSTPLQYPQHASQLTRILNSDINTEILASLSQNEHELHYLQQILSNKNEQVTQLHSLINDQLNKTISQNNILKNYIFSVRQMLSTTKQEFDLIKSSVKQLGSYFYSALKQIGSQLDKQRQREATLQKEINRQRLVFQSKEAQWLKERQQQRLREKQREKEMQMLMEKLKQKEKAEKKVDKGRQSGVIVGQKRLGLQISVQTQPQNLECSVPPHLLQRLEQLQQTVLSLKQQKWQLQKCLQKYQIESHPSSPSSTHSSKQQQFSYQCIAQLFSNSFSTLTQHRYQGQLLNNKKYGKGICQYNNNFAYEGQFVNGLRHGIGQMKHEGNLIYRGEWVKGQVMGKGCLCLGSEGRLRIMGNFVKGKIEGVGTVVKDDGSRVRGVFKDGRLFGDVLVEDYEGNVVQFGQVREEHNINIDILVANFELGRAQH